MSVTPGTLPIVDGVKATQSVRTELSSDGSVALHSVPEINGTAGFTNTNPGRVARATSSGQDFSSNTPTLPAIGRSFGATGPFAGWVRVLTVPAQTSRLHIEINNLSGGKVLIIRDDGTAADGAIPQNASMIVMAGGSSTATEGATWTSSTFCGRIQVYAPAANAFVSVAVD